MLPTYIASFESQYCIVASRLGRRPKKTLKSSAVSSTDFNADTGDNSDSQMSILPAGSSQQTNLDYPSLARAALSDMFGCSPEMMQNFSKMSSVFSAAGPNPFNMMEKHSVQSSQDNAALDCSLSAMTVTGEYNSESITRNDLNEWREKQFAVMSKYMHSTKGNLLRGGSDASGEAIASMPHGLMGTGCENLVSSTSENEVTHQMLASDITTASDEQVEKISQFIEYCRSKNDSKMLSIRQEVHQSVIDSHMKHCYHLRARINAASAELDAKEQVSKLVL